MHALTITRQALSRALYPSVLRRRFTTLRHQVAASFSALHRAELGALIKWTREDIEAIDREMDALPIERLAHQRDLLMLEARLRDLSGR